MAHSSYPIKYVAHTKVAVRSASRYFGRPILRWWMWACRHAERPGRFVPYY